MVVGCVTENGGNATFTMCGANACLDLSDPKNAPLASVGGSAVIRAGGATIIIVRTGDATVSALSDICTHESCNVDYSPSSMLLVCPCHGSEFRLTGAVARGPARIALRSYTATLDAATNTITVTL